MNVGSRACLGAKPCAPDKRRAVKSKCEGLIMSQGACGGVRSSLAIAFALARVRSCEHIDPRVAHRGKAVIQNIPCMSAVAA